jgi:hypothetical protein
MYINCSNDFAQNSEKVRRKCIKKIATILSTLCDNNRDEICDLSDSPFFKNVTYNISLFDYLIRLEKYYDCSDSIIIAMLIYIDRLDFRAKIYINKNSAHRIVIAAYNLANKYMEDEHFSNEYYAKVAGLSLDELNMLEREMLKHLNYELHIDAALYESYAINFMM